jgi:anti-anti-sigma factor
VATPRLDRIEVEHPAPGTAVASFFGEHDLATSEAARVLLASLIEDHDLVVVDLSPAEFVDASILRVLVGADLHARVCGRRLRLQLATAPIVELAVTICGVRDTLDCVTTREHALETHRRE